MPLLYAADDAGASLWEFVPGRPLTELVAEDSATDFVWHRLGDTLATVHAVTFPAPLQGPLGPDSFTLSPTEPAEQLQAAITAHTPWAEQNQPHLIRPLRHLHTVVSTRADQLRAHQPAVTHGDVNFLNIIVSDHAVRLIDWDHPTVRYPLAELAALGEHAYLHGIEALPASFYNAYGRTVPPDLLLIYRIIGCLGWLDSSEWTDWDHDLTIPDPARTRLRHWHQRLLRWTERIPDLIDTL